jgi:EmrB/QacA subfamily drug resistance transporter
MHPQTMTRRQIVFTLIGLSLGVLLSALDSTIVGTAMPTIIRELKGIEHYSWPFTSYILLSTAAIPVFGKLADIYGRKRIYLIGIIVFIISSVLCGLSRSMTDLIIFRGLQGIGGGILISNAFAVIGEMFSPRERGKYIGYIVSMFGVASIIGPLFGGIISEHLSWRWVFYVNIPIGLVAFFIMATEFHSHFHLGKIRSIDYAGNIVFLLILVPLMIGLSIGGRDYSWHSPFIMVLFLVPLFLFPLFMWIEKNAQDPLIPLFLFKKSVFNLSVLCSFFSNSVFFGGIIFVPLFMQNVLGASPTFAGLCIMPMTLSFVITTIFTGKIVSRTGHYRKLQITGFAFALVGTLLLFVLNQNSTTLHTIIAVTILGIGLGINTPIFNIASQVCFSRAHLGVVTSTLQLCRNVGGAAGSALFGSVMAAGLLGGIREINFGSLPSSVVQSLSDPHTLMNRGSLAFIRSTISPNLLSAFDSAMRQMQGAFAHSVHYVFALTVIVASLTLVVSFFIKELPLGGHDREEMGKKG